MSKKHRAEKTVLADQQEDFDDMDDEEWNMDQVTVTAIRGLVESARFNADIALNLTALLVENSAPSTFSKEALFALYREAIEVAAESSPMKQVVEIISGE